MRALVIGAGGREHALAWKLAQSPSVEEVWAAPGNPGIAQVARCMPCPDASPAGLAAIAEELDADLTVVGPEAPLVAGVVDAFRAVKRHIVGPTAEWARLEGSKVFAKQFFTSHGIPTAEFSLAGDWEEARKALSGSRFPVAVKADGLAAGKGVVIARDRAEAETAIQQLGFPLVIEEFIEGQEVSFIVLADGKDVMAFEPCQDHKRIYDDDQGPNTGGMGAYCDSRLLSEKSREDVLNRIIRPTIAATGFTGFLYAGLMMTANGPMLLEYNVRMGDPETQPIMHRMLADFGQVLMSAANGRLREVRVDWRPEPSVCVVLASQGYPQSTQAGIPITGVEAAEAMGTVVFHSGTKTENGRLVTAGGRVVGVTGRGANLDEAIVRTYSGVGQIHFAGMQYRTDIGRKGLERDPTSLLRRKAQPLQ